MAGVPARRGMAEQLANETNVEPETTAGAQSRWGVFANSAFTVLLIANSVSSLGVAMFDTATSWLMTSLSTDPAMVSAVQVATTLPLFLLTIPAGALSDVVDPRRLLIAAQVTVAAISIGFAGLASAGLIHPFQLLGTTLLLGTCGALSAPAWLLTAPMLVPRQQLDSAIALDNATYNVSRAIGPAIAGLAIAGLGLVVPFWCYCAGNLALLAALIWWRAPRRPMETLPAERLVSAISVGLRYAQNSRDLDSTLIRAIAFFPFGCAYWALLPLVARTQLHNGAEVFGAVMAMIGVGSIAGTLALNGLKAPIGARSIGRPGHDRHRGRACAVRRGPGAHRGVRGRLYRGGVMDRDADDAVRVRPGCASRMGARTRPGHFPQRLLWRDDAWAARFGARSRNSKACLSPFPPRRSERWSEWR